MLTLGEKLKLLMSEKNWSQAETARRLDISPQMINYYISNKRTPTLEGLKKMARVFDVDINLFINDFEDRYTFTMAKDLVYGSYSDKNNIEAEQSNESNFFRIDVSDLNEEEVAELKKGVQEYTDFLKNKIKGKNNESQ